jgi:hypothetical protein
MNRPFSATLLAIIAGIAGVVALLDVLRYLGILPIVTIGPLDLYGGVSIIGAMMAFLVALIWFWAAKGIWNLEEEAWLFVVVIAIVYLIFDFMALIAAGRAQNLSLSILVNFIALGLAILPATQRAFGRK